MTSSPREMRLVRALVRPGLCVSIATLAALLTTSAYSQSKPYRPSTAEVTRWKKEAAETTITRDDWGIAHIHGKTDADAVFGMEYAQAEDDFNRVEMNYLTSLGRTAEAEGESKIYQDLRQKLFLTDADLKQDYAASPAWLQKLMNAFADGLNFYLYTHPEVKPHVLTHFEPWMALSFTEGSIGGDIERIRLPALEAFYSKPASVAETSASAPYKVAVLPPNDQEGGDELNPREPTGSNGVAIAPSNTVDHHALLLINPHTSFFFRSELQMSSDEGLDAYGAVTWGQFFIYQGFNPHVGWMHTSSGVDAVDEYLETVTRKGDGFVYKYGSEERPVKSQVIGIPYKTATGMAEKRFTVYKTHHGPIISQANGKWIAFRMMNRPIKALEQSYLRTKATDYASYRRTMELKANSSNNTIFASSNGDIAYYHGNFIPRRDTRFDFTKPVDGSNPATDWHGLLTVAELPQLHNPKSGWLYNSNNWPWSGAGESSLKREDYPAYVEMGIESARGLHVIRVLKGKHDFTLDSLISAAYDSYLTWFDKPLPALFAAWDHASSDNPLKAKLAPEIAALRGWDHRWSVDSVPTSLAVFWGEEVRRDVGLRARNRKMMLEDYVAEDLAPGTLLDALDAAVQRLTTDFGTWKTPWGKINRYQRINGDIVQPFNDSKPSIPVGFTSGIWGSIASFGARPYPGTKKWYGTSGNSFVAVVEFGPHIRAKAVTAGGESGHPDSKHFNDEAERYATGHLRDVYFYPADLKGHTEAVYHPGSGDNYE